MVWGPSLPPRPPKLPPTPPPKPKPGGKGARFLGVVMFAVAGLVLVLSAFGGLMR